MYDLSKNKGKPNINLTFYVRFSTLASTSVAFSSSSSTSSSFGYSFALALGDILCAIIRKNKICHSRRRCCCATAASSSSSASSASLYILSIWVRAMSCGMSNKRASHQLYGQITQITAKPKMKTQRKLTAANTTTTTTKATTQKKQGRFVNFVGIT